LHLIAVVASMHCSSAVSLSIFHRFSCCKLVLSPGNFAWGRAGKSWQAGLMWVEVSQMEPTAGG
jgi:hypothetical protein